MKTLTAANSVILLGVNGLFPTPFQLQGFAADDIFDTDQLDIAETVMGVDGKMSAGWVPQIVKQNYSLQADSDSVAFFEAWYQSQQRVREVYSAVGSITLPATGRVYTLSKGILVGYSPTPSAKKTLQPRKFTIAWEAITQAPF